MTKIDDIVNNKYSIEFTKINLENNRGKKYEGKGNIYQNSDGQLLLKMYSCDTKGYDIFDSDKNVKPGKYIPKSAYYKFSGVDTFGHTWNSNRVDCGFDVSSNMKDIIINGTIYSIHKTTKSFIKPKKTTYRLKFRKYFDLPLVPFVSPDAELHRNRKNTNDFRIRANIVVSDYELLFFETKNWLNLDIIPRKGRLNQNFLIRICEALQFISSNHIYWDIFEKYEPKKEKITIRSTSHLKHYQSLPSPFDLRDSTSEHIWELFQKYLTFIISHKGDKYHPISQQIYKMIQSSNAALEIHSLTITVAIESLLKSEISKYCNIVNKIEVDSKELKDHIKSGSYKQNFKNRILGALSAMNNPRAIDYLNYLLQKKTLLKKDIKAWNKIRNSTVHADKNDSIMAQKYLNLIFICLMLFYKLIFLVLNYRGAYNDISIYGWSKKKFSKCITSSSSRPL